jgi:hypothetical protein
MKIVHKKQIDIIGDYPKSTVNFLAESLWKRGYLAKSIRSKTHYYEADITLLESLLKAETREKEAFLTSVVPLLREMNANTRSKPKITFFDGVENCKKAYLELLDAKEIFYEFWAHGDLVAAFGHVFMDDFIRRRVEKGIFCDSISTAGPIDLALHERDDRELRSLRLFDPLIWAISSSIAIYGDRVLILNLEGGATGICIENQAFAETMRTIFCICRGW